MKFIHNNESECRAPLTNICVSRSTGRKYKLLLAVSIQPGCKDWGFYIKRPALSPGFRSFFNLCDHFSTFVWYLMSHNIEFR